MEPRREETWRLTREAFDGLLARLSSDRARAAEEYEKLRRKLFSFFDWRGSTTPDAHADETLDRVARRLAEGEDVAQVSRYVYGVARRILLEWERRRSREQAAIEELRRRAGSERADPEAKRRLACLERCLSALPGPTRALIVQYYEPSGASGPDHRRALALRLGLPYGALKTRAHRVRARLEACLRDCLSGSTSAVEAGPPRADEPETPIAPAGPATAADDTVGYLLGTLSLEEQERLEERYFDEDAFYEELLAASDDLIHAYLAGRLSPEEERRFEDRFLASKWRRQRVQFMEDLLTVVSRVPARSVSAVARPATRVGPAFWWAAAALVILAVALHERGAEVPRPAVGPSPPVRPPASSGLPSQAPVPAARSTRTVRVTRDAPLPVTVEVPPGARTVRLEVDVEPGRLAYDATLTRAGRQVWHAEELALSPQDGPLVVPVPAEILSEGDYVLSVEAEAFRAEDARAPRVVPLRVVRRP